jgi:uncharacterized BrkB/YihY/UPF0761 family membrane protein
MRTMLQVVAVLLLVVGVPATALASLALIYAWLAPIQADPLMNEGPAMAWALGWIFLVPSALAIVVAVAMLYRLNATRPATAVEWAGKHKRWW